MKQLIPTIPVWGKVLLYFMLLAVATTIAGIVPAVNSFLFIMLVAAALSWLFLRTEGKSIMALRFIPTRAGHIRQFVIGTATGCSLLVATAAITLWLTGDAWQLNLPVDPTFFLATFIACLGSAFVQEFVFRGYPFQALLEQYGAWRAQLFIAIPFALMHIHTAMGLQDMLAIALTTGIGSILFGLAFIRTKHLMLPAGLHLGWNFAQALIPRTSGNSGPSLIAVYGDPQHYTFLNVISPYVVVMLSAILFLAYSRHRAATTVHQP